MELSKNQTYGGYVLLFLILATGSLIAFNMLMTLSSRDSNAKELARSAEIEITSIAAVGCDSCVDINAIIDAVKKQPVQVNKEEQFTMDSEEGKKLVETYQITRAPALLIKGEIEKENVREFFGTYGRKSEDGTLIIEPKQPIYFDLAENKIVGEISLTTISDSECSECYDPAIHQSILKNNFGVTITKTEALDANSGQGKTYVQRYAIKELPAFLLSGDVTSYDALVKVWEQVGTIEQDGTFVFRGNEKLSGLVYKDLSTGKIVKPETTE
ncbi:hypothetical protein HYV69_03165 [Candidatus Uhrbacteria bacterium]|nr:hypothetical protein [Candidatus Uhrbacteria bacterium]